MFVHHRLALGVDGGLRLETHHLLHLDPEVHHLVRDVPRRLSRRDQLVLRALHDPALEVQVTPRHRVRRLARELGAEFPLANEIPGEPTHLLQKMVPVRLIPPRLGEVRLRLRPRGAIKQVPRAVHHRVLVPNPRALGERRLPSLLPRGVRDWRRARGKGRRRGALHPGDRQGDAAGGGGDVLVEGCARSGVRKEGAAGSVARIVEARTIAARRRAGIVIRRRRRILRVRRRRVRGGGAVARSVGRRGGGGVRGRRRARELVVFVLAPQEALDGDSALLAEGVHLRADGFRIQRFAAELLLERLRRVLAGGLVGGVEDELGVRVRVRARAALEAAPRERVVALLRDDRVGGARRSRARRPSRLGFDLARGGGGRRAARRASASGEHGGCRRRAGLEPARWARARWTGRGGEGVRGRATRERARGRGGGSEGRERDAKMRAAGGGRARAARGTRRSRTRRAKVGEHAQLGLGSRPSSGRPRPRPTSPRRPWALRDRRAAPSSRARASARAVEGSTTRQHQARTV